MRPFVLKTYRAIGFGLLMLPAGAFAGLVLVGVLQVPLAAAEYARERYGFQVGLAALVASLLATYALIGGAIYEFTRKEKSNV